MPDDVQEAIRTLIRWAGDDPGREGLIDTPARVLRAYAEWFGGYGEDPVALLERTFGESGGYDGIVLLRDIRFVSHCEHHMAPVQGRAHVAYLPGARVVGISKLTRIVELYARRLQIQERMTAQIADAIEGVLQPKGVAVAIEATHGCMVTRGVIRRNSQIRVVREGAVIYETTIASLKRFKDDVREVQEGFECGILLENFNDVKEGDVLEAYETRQIERTDLEVTGGNVGPPPEEPSDES